MWLALLLAGMLAISGCGQGQPPAPANTFLKGVSLSPRSTSAADFVDFFEKTSQTGPIVMWAGDWLELTTTEGAATVVASLAATYNYTPLIEAQFFDQATGQLLRPLTGTTREAYKNGAADFAARYNLKYLGLGIEVNTLAEKSPSDFNDFAAFFSEVYDAVKARSPNTKVFTVWQLEKMKGLNGGLFGGVNDPTKAQWDLLARFPKSDLTVFTTYPCLIYKDPVEIPAGYYTEISSRTAKAVGFTEIGWYSGADIPSWESSETEQASFITAFFDLSAGLNKELALWSFMYDPAAAAPFDSMGLRRSSDGAAKLAWPAWINSN